MRVPGNIKDSIHAYLAMRAILVAITQWNRQNPPIRSVAIPSLGTGVGGMYYETAAEQMRTAYEMIVNEQWRNIVHPMIAPYAGQKKWNFKMNDL
jgi:O-acetyl-ADP-ribose deacetylase (regulator of RNase III)